LLGTGQSVEIGTPTPNRFSANGSSRDRATDRVRPPRRPIALRMAFAAVEDTLGARPERTPFDLARRWSGPP
jgi:hypothetical protein